MDIQISQREAQLLHYLREGLRPGTIAVKMLVSQRRVEGIISELKQRWSCSTQAELMAFAYEHNIIKINAENRIDQPEEGR